MFHAREWRTRAHHAIARLEQRLIVSFSVVGDQHVESSKVRSQRCQKRRLFAVIAHEELAHAEPGLVDTTHADQKRIRARAAREPRGFGVEKSPARGTGLSDGAFGKRRQQTLRQIGQVRDAH